MLDDDSIWYENSRLVNPEGTENENFRKWPLKNCSLKTNANNSIELSFALPKSVTGKVILVVLSGTQLDSSFIYLNGSNGEASCVKGSNSLNCIINLDNLNLDEDIVRDYLRENFSDPIEFEARMSVAQRFSGEPIGLISLTNQ